MFMSEDALGEEKFHKISKECFIEQIKTDTEFSKKWGLNIEERELDMMERWKIADLTPNMEEFDFANYMCDKHNVSTKIITVTYNDKTIESYE
jgi:Fe-S cluster biosynthesis and repair protein YggX